MHPFYLIYSINLKNQCIDIKDNALIFVIFTPRNKENSPESGIFANLM